MIRSWPLPNDAETCALGDLLLNETGVCLGHDRAQWMRDRLESLFSRHGLEDWQQVVRRVDQDAAFRRKVIDALLTQETRWFRDQSLFSCLPDLLGEQAAYGGGRQRIGFFGCATGQEVYSALIALDQAGLLGDGSNGLVQPPALALDVSAQALQKASAGCYSLAQMQRGMPPELLARYFETDGDEYRVCQHLRQWVDFRQASLLNFVGIGSFDILFCRNVLVYFSPELRAVIQQRLVKHLNPFGVLVLGASEKPTGEAAERLQRIVLGAVPAYRFIPPNER